MTWADSSVSREADRRWVKCREEVRTGNTLLIKHYSTVINILPVEIRSSDAVGSSTQASWTPPLHSSTASSSFCGVNLDNYAF